LVFRPRQYASARKTGLDIIFGVVQAGLTSAIAAGIASIGTLAFLENWLGSWLIAWATTIPIVLLAAPVIRRLVVALTIERGDGGKGA
jgi:hypothetical protein